MICKATAVTAFPFPQTPVSGPVRHNVGGWKEYSGLVVGWAIHLTCENPFQYARSHRRCRSHAFVFEVDNLCQAQIAWYEKMLPCLD
jgi:hypothetical protein